MKTIVVRNRKGGVGKTTIATHLAAGLALDGKRVLIVDTDPQGHAAKAFGMAKRNSLYELMSLEDMSQIAEAAQSRLFPVPIERYAPPQITTEGLLLVLPSDKGTSLIPTEQQNPFVFSHMISELSAWLVLDYVVVDTGPSASLFDGSVNFAADGFVYVTELAGLSYDGLGESVREMDLINRSMAKYRNHETQILGIIPNKADFRTRAHRELHADLQRYAETHRYPLWPPVMLGIMWQEAMNHGQSVWSYAPTSKEAETAASITQAVSGKLHADA